MGFNMKDKRQKTTVLLITAILVTILPSMMIMTFIELTAIKVFVVIFVYTAFLMLIALEITEKQKIDTKNEVLSLLEKEKMINGTLVSINNEEKLKNFLALEIERIRLVDKSSSVIFFDVDDLGLINLTHGYDIGDQLLIELIRMTQANISEHDQIARIKGDTFSIILPNKTKQEAYVLTEKLSRLLSHMRFGDVGKVSCRFAVLGIFKTSNEDKIIQLAYEKLAQCKALGHGSVL